MTTETIETVPHPPQQRCFRLRKFLIRAFWVSVFLSIAIVLWGLWYLNNRGFSRKWRRALTGEFEKRGFYVGIGRLTLNPFRGLVAKEVRVMNAREHGKVLAIVNEIVLDINYSNLVHHEPFLNALDLRDAQLSLPLDSEGRSSQRLDISNLNAQVLLPPHQLVVTQAEANVHGLHVSCKGTVINPDQFRQEPGKSADKSHSSSGSEAYQWMHWLDQLKIKGGAPNVEIQFAGDLSEPQDLLVDAVLQSGKFTVGDLYKVRSVQVIAKYSNGTVRLDQCAISDESGELDATGTFQPASKSANLQLRSTLNVKAILKATRLTHALDSWSFYSPPALELKGDVSWKDGFHPRLLGRLSVDRFASKTKAAMFEGASADFSWDGDRWYVRGARLDHLSGSLIVSAMQTADGFRVSLDSRINPKALVSLLPGKPDPALMELGFEAAPEIHLEGQGPSPSLDRLTATGQIRLGASRFRGTSIISGTSAVVLKDGAFSFKDFKLVRPEGMATGTFVYDFRKGEVRLANVKATVNPVEIGAWIDKDMPHYLAPYRFKRRPAVLVDGTVQFRNGSARTKLRVDVDGADGMDYTFAKKNLSMPKIRGTVWVIRDRLLIEDLDASLFGGHLTGKADIDIARGKHDYSADIQALDIDFPALTKLYFDYDTAKGKLTGSYDFTGDGDSARAMNGHGELTVTDGNVFAIPLFGPFSGILNQILPGSGYNVAHKGSATFQVHNGVITTDDMLVAGKGFSMLGGGKLYFVDDKIDFSIRINAQGAVGVLLTPVSKLLEYTADTSLSKPNWHPKRLPRGLFTHEPHEKPKVNEQPKPASSNH